MPLLTSPKSCGVENDSICRTPPAKGVRRKENQSTNPPLSWHGPGSGSRGKSAETQGRRVWTGPCSRPVSTTEHISQTQASPAPLTTGRFRTARAQRQLLRCLSPEHPCKPPLNRSVHDPFKTASGVQHSGPWDPWLPVVEKKPTFCRARAQRTVRPPQQGVQHASTHARTQEHMELQSHQHFATQTDPSCSPHKATTHILYWTGAAKTMVPNKKAPKCGVTGSLYLDRPGYPGRQGGNPSRDSPLANPPKPPPAPRGPHFSSTAAAAHPHIPLSGSSA